MDVHTLLDANRTAAIKLVKQDIHSLYIVAKKLVKTSCRKK